MRAEGVWEFEAIGTHWQIQISESSTDQSRDLKQRIQERIAVYDKNYSRFRDDSLVHEIAQKVGTYILPEDGKKLFDFYRDLYDATKGAVTPLIGQVLSDAGYDASYSFQARDLTVPLTWDEALKYEFPNLTVHKPVLLDVGAAGKGYLVDIVAQIIEDAGINEYIINAGGDFRVKSASNAYKIGLEHPDDSTKVLGYVELMKGGVCGSAGNRRAWRGFHHILNPHTLKPVDTVKAVWVTSEEALIADGIATALFFASPHEVLTRLGSTYAFEFLVVYPDFSIEKSVNFPGTLFLEESNR